MSVIYTDSVLKSDTKYKVQDVSKFPKDKQYLVGKEVIFKAVTGSTASIRGTGGNMMEVPVRSLIKVQGFKAKGVASKNADGFVVVAQNGLKIEVGTAYLNPTEVTNTHASFNIDGRIVKLPLDICAALVKEEVKIDKDVKKELKKASKASGISVHMVQAMDSDANRKDLDGVPAFILKLFPQLNIDYVKDLLKQQDGVWADYEGNVHNTVEEADKANTILRHKMLEQKILLMVEEHTRLEFQSNRLAEIKAR